MVTFPQSHRCPRTKAGVVRPRRRSRLLVEQCETRLLLNARPSNPSDIALNDIIEDVLDADNAGTTVNAIIHRSGSTDPEEVTIGIAVTETNEKHGIWQFSTPEGWKSIGVVSEVSALLLDETAEVRFVPDQDFSGIGLKAPSFDFKAWDKTSGDHGGRIDSRGIVPESSEVSVVPTAGDPQEPTVVPRNDGGYFLIWRDTSERFTHLQQYDSAGNKVGSRSKITSAHDGGPAVGQFADGSFVVAYQATGPTLGRDVFFQRLDSDGSKLGAEQHVAGGFFPRLTSHGNGEFVVAYVRENKLYFQRFDSDAKPDGPEVEVDSGLKGTDSAELVTLSNGNILLTWDVGRTLFGQRFKPDGTVLDANKFQINVDLDVSSHDLVALSNGGFVATWDSTSSTQSSQSWGRRFDDNAIALDQTEFKVNQNERAQVPSITSASNGGFTIVWREPTAGGKIKGQRFNADAQPLGSELQVSTGPRSQDSPNIVNLSDGGLVVVWRQTTLHNKQVFRREYRPDPAFSLQSGEARHDVTAVNDAPVIGHISKETDENVSIQFSSSDFTDVYSDVENDPLEFVTVTLPLRGTLTVGGANVDNGDTIVADKLGDLVYEPDLNYSGEDEFSWSGSDGSDSSMPSDVQIKIIRGNAKPVVSDFTRAVVEEVTLPFHRTDFTDADVFQDDDGDDLVKIQITELPTEGTLELNGTEVTSNQVISTVNLDGLSYTSNPEDDVSRPLFQVDSFAWRGHDGIEYSASDATSSIEVFQETITVTIPDDDDDGNLTLNGVSLREAVAVANRALGANRIIVDSSSFGLPLTEGALVITEELSIEGNGKTIDANDQSQIFHILPFVTVAISNLELTGAVGFNGGAIYNSGDLTLTNVVLVGNTAQSSGGAIYNHADALIVPLAGTLHLINSTISGNTALRDGGGIHNHGHSFLGKDATAILKVTNSTIAQNRANVAGFADAGGGGISNLGQVTLHNAIVAGNAGVEELPDDIRGTVDAFSSMVQHVSDDTLLARSTNNLTNVDPLLGPLDFHGGLSQTHSLLFGSPAIDAGDNSLAVDAKSREIPFDLRGFNRVSDGDLDGQRTVDIGAFEFAEPFLVNTIVDENNGVGVGKGTSLREAVEAANNTPGRDTILFHPDRSQGVINLDDHIEVRDDTHIEGPGADRMTISGQGQSTVFVFIANSSSITGLTIRDGFSDRDAGGILVTTPLRQTPGRLFLRNVHLTENQGILGGAIHSTNSHIAVAGSTISLNRARNGAGISSNHPESLVVVRNSTISGNHADINGGGISLFDAQAFIVNTTIANNHAGSAGSGNGEGGGLSIAGLGSATVHNTIIAENRRGSSLSDQIAGEVEPNSSHNLIGTSSQSSIGSGNMPSGNGNIFALTARLGELQDNGGTTPSHALLGSSLAIDAGSSTLANDFGLDNDQRGDGFKRIDPGGLAIVDIGAFEAAVTPQTFTVTTLLDENDGALDLGDGNSLREVIEAANNTPGRDTILFHPDHSQGVINLDDHIEVRDDTHIEGPGADRMTISGQGQSTVFVFIANSSSITGLTIRDGFSDRDAGGILVTTPFRQTPGSLSLRNVHLTENQGILGGAIRSTNSHITVAGSTISLNRARNGAGISSNHPDSLVVVRNSTISGNHAEVNGGGISLFDTQAFIVNSTIANNHADSDGSGNGEGGGLSIAGLGSATVHNTIIAENRRGSSLSDQIAGEVEPNSSHNLIGTSSQSSIGSGNMPSGNGNIFALTARLGELQDNGGTTPSHALLGSSLAIDAGSSTLANDFGLDNDQRGDGFKRIDPGGLAIVDIGAFEAIATSETFQVTTLIDEDDSALGQGSGDSLREVLQAANDSPGLDKIEFHPNLTRGVIELTVDGLEIQDGVVINGPGSEMSVSGATRYTVFSIASGHSSIRGLTVRDGVGQIDDTGGILLSSTDLIPTSVVLDGVHILDHIGRGLTSNNAAVTINNSIISGNISGREGGGIYSTGDLSVHDSTISGNTSDVEGGGIYSTGDLSVAGSTISGNSSRNDGGGVFSEADLTVRDSTISGNTSDGQGAGIFSRGTLTVLNSTISGNQSTRDGGGIALANGAAILINVTIAHNSTSNGVGGGLSIRGQAPAVLHNAIVADNVQGTLDDSSEIAGTIDPFSTHNLIGTVFGAADSGRLPEFCCRNIYAIDPRLSELQDNGGSTLTHALLNGSPAVDSGNPLVLIPGQVVDIEGIPLVIDPALDSDQRGGSFDRNQDGSGRDDPVIDIGAFEFFDNDTDGVDAGTETQAPNNGDGNNDGIADSDQTQVTSLPSLTGDFVTVAASGPGAGPLANVAVVDLATDDLPADFPIGFVKFDVSEDDSSGGAEPKSPDDVFSTEVMLFLETPQPINAYYKFNGIDIVVFQGATFIDDNGDGFVEAIKLSLVDGGDGDLDGLQNGVIVDPGAPGFNPAPVVHSINATNLAVIGQPITASVQFSDMGNEAHTVIFHWGDGSKTTKTLSPSTGKVTVQAAHSYTRPDDYTVRVGVVDGISASSIEKPLSIVASLPVTDSGGSDETTLIVGGTPGNDRIVFRPRQKGKTIEANLNGVVLGEFPVDELSKLIAYGGQGRDRIIVHPRITIPTELHGGRHNDNIRGGGGNDQIHGGRGNDQIRGRSGVDSLFGGTGRDRIIAGAGADLIKGNGGGDIISAGPGADIVHGGNGNDRISGGSGGDVIYGDGGNDIIRSQSGDDFVVGGPGSDRLNGGAGHDLLVGVEPGDITIGEVMSIFEFTPTRHPHRDPVISDRFELHETTLDGLLAEWREVSSVEARIERIRQLIG